MKRKLAVTADCTCDLSDELLKKYNTELLRFSVITEHGCFLDKEEITASNILDYISEGGKARSSAPDTDECIRFFTEQLEKSEQVIHICMSSDTSLSYRNCCEAIKIMGEKAAGLRLFDSRHLSSGTGIMVLRASEMAENGTSADEIIKELMMLRKKISTSFIVRNADCLLNNSKISVPVRRIFDFMDIHPVIRMENGKMKLKLITSFIIRGSYEKAQLRYISSELKKYLKMNKYSVFITHAGCSFRVMDTVRKRVERNSCFRHIYVTEASSAVSVNCGPETLGLIYITE